MTDKSLGVPEESIRLKRYRGYYMAVRRNGFYFRVLILISLTSE